jgi:F420-non-reducing hydrogenase small subunit
MSMAEKLKLAMYWAASCGGCEISIVDLNEKILDVIKIADFVFWPVAMDFKYSDVEAMPDKFIDVCLFNGAIRSSENEHIAHLLRRKSKILIAYGACAYNGGIPGLANMTNRQGMFDTVYKTVSTNQNTLPKISARVPEGELELPQLYDTVKSLAQVVDVDYYVPGCPPAPKIVEASIDAIASGKLPPKGSVIGPSKALCEECPREKTDKKITAMKRTFEGTPDTKRCLLEQGYLCMGPATREGCGTPCINANMPCTGCSGPADDVTDQGAKMMSALTSVLALEGEENVSEENVLKMIREFPDPMGVFYKYTMPTSTLKRRVMK